MRILRVLLKGIDSLSELVGRPLSFLVLPIMCITLYEVVMRSVFNSPTMWAHESSTWIYGTYGIMGGAYVLRHNGHVNMDIVYRRLSLRTQAIVDSLSWLLFFTFIGIMLWQGGMLTIRSIKVGECSQTSWGPPIYPFKTILFLGTFLMLSSGLVYYIRRIFIAITGRSEL